jgi:hypothetical protein
MHTHRGRHGLRSRTHALRSRTHAHNIPNRRASHHGRPGRTNGYRIQHKRMAPEHIPQEARTPAPNTRQAVVRTPEPGRHTPAQEQRKPVRERKSAR